jgi:hypothetical protein
MVEPRMTRPSPIIKANKEALGRKVINPQGKSLGKIEEIMLDAAPGRIAYAVLSFGGFLGLGDKLFAVPWNALNFDPEKRSLRTQCPQAIFRKRSRF